MKIKTLSTLLALLSASLAVASPVTTDQIVGPVNGLTLYNGQDVITFPTNYNPNGEQALTQNSAVTVYNKTYEQSSNIAKEAFGLYDYTVSGGTIGNYNLGMGLPNKAVITKVWMDVITQPVGSGGSVGLSAASTSDMFNPLVTQNFTVGQWLGKPQGTSSTTVKLSAATGVTLNITGANLSAGKIAVFIDYLISD